MVDGIADAERSRDDWSVDRSKSPAAVAGATIQIRRETAVGCILLVSRDGLYGVATSRNSGSPVCHRKLSACGKCFGRSTSSASKVAGESCPAAGATPANRKADVAEGTV